MKEEEKEESGKDFIQIIIISLSNGEKISVAIPSMFPTNKEAEGMKIERVQITSPQPLPEGMTIEEGILTTNGEEEG